MIVWIAGAMAALSLSASPASAGPNATTYRVTAAGRTTGVEAFSLVPLPNTVRFVDRVTGAHILCPSTALSGYWQLGKALTGAGVARVGSGTFRCTGAMTTGTVVGHLASPMRINVTEPGGHYEQGGHIGGVNIVFVDEEHAACSFAIIGQVRMLVLLRPHSSSLQPLTEQSTLRIADVVGCDGRVAVGDHVLSFGYFQVITPHPPLVMGSNP
ncbi:MAG: hypothetical protein ABI083_18635 [Lapillicoccus sp.]